MTMTKERPVEQLIPALNIEQMPGFKWIHGDDLCDCTFQRIGEWTNPYIAETLRVRMCCLWERIYAQYPDLVSRLPGFYNANTDKFETEVMAWDSDEVDMPTYLWERQLSHKHKKPLNVIREEVRAGKYGKNPKKVGKRAKIEYSAEQIKNALLSKLGRSGWNTKDFE